MVGAAELLLGLIPAGANKELPVAATRVAAVRQVRALDAARDAGTALLSGRSMTVADWLEHWLTTVPAPRLAWRTVESYESHLRRHLVPHLGHHRLDRLQPSIRSAATPTC